MVCLYGVAIEPGNYVGNSTFISTAPFHAALEENPKPQKIVTQASAYAHTMSNTRLSAKASSNFGGAQLKKQPDKRHPKQIKNHQIHIVFEEGIANIWGKKTPDASLTTALSNTYSNIKGLQTVLVVAFGVNQPILFVACWQRKLDIKYGLLKSRVTDQQFGDLSVTASRLRHFRSIFGEISLGK